MARLGCRRQAVARVGGPVAERPRSPSRSWQGAPPRSNLSICVLASRPSHAYTAIYIWESWLIVSAVPLASVRTNSAPTTTATIVHTRASPACPRAARGRVRRCRRTARPWRRTRSTGSVAPWQWRAEQGRAAAAAPAHRIWRGSWLRRLLRAVGFDLERLPQRGDRQGLVASGHPDVDRANLRGRDARRRRQARRLVSGGLP